MANTEEIVQYVLDCFENANSSYRATKLKEWEKWLKLALGKRSPTSFPFDGCSNVDLGTIPIHTKSLQSRLKMSIVGTDPIFQLTPTEERDVEGKQQREDTMSWLLTNHLIGKGERVGISPIVDAICYQSVVYGTCLTKIRWQTETQKKKITPPNMGIFGVGEPMVVSEEVEKLKVDMLSLEDFFVPDDAESIQTATYCIHRVYLTEQELKNRKSVYQNIDEVEKWFEKEKKETTSLEKIEGKEAKASQKKIEVIEFYGKYEGEEMIYTVATKSKVLLRTTPLIDVYATNRRPFHRFVFEDIGSFYGRGIPELLEQSADALNHIYNFSVNMGYYQMMPCGFIDENVEIPNFEFSLSPAKLTRINGNPHQSIMFLNYPTQSGVGQQFIGILNNFIERQTAISSPMQGVETTEKKTATEIRTVIEEGNIRHNDRIKSFQVEISHFLKAIYQLYQQNIPEKLLMKIMGITRQQFQSGDEDFTILGTLTSGNKVIEREDNMTLYSLLSQNPLIQQDPDLNIDLLLNILQTFDKKGLVKKIEGIKDKMMEQQKMAQLQEAIMSQTQQPIS